MSLRPTHLKLIGAAGAAALTVSVLASPAAAVTKNLTYNCSVGDPAPLGKVASTLNTGKIPAKMTAGQSVRRNMTLAVHLDQTQTGLAQALGTHVKGTVSTKGPLAFKLKIPNTAIPATPGATMDVTGSGKGTITPNRAGKFKLNAAAIAAVLKLSGGAPLTAHQTCKAPKGAAKTVATIAVKKDASKTVASAKYSAKKKTTVAAAKVKGAKFGLAGTGKVKFVLKKGIHTLKSAKGKLKHGVAHVKLKKALGKGTYSITVKFAGDKGLKGSSAKKTFKVK
jgi:hypothetical protein